jgi:prefoldin subunit 5
MDYCILTLPFSRGLSQIDSASILARAVRAADTECKTENVIQYPVLDGGEGTLELLVTTRLGAFLEVEAKNFIGEEIVVPLGFVGEDQSIAIIRMGSLRSEAHGFETCGTTYGAGELIRDALDEGAFSVLLALDAPIARDAGFGLAAALGVKFFDASDHEIDLSKPVPDLFERIQRIDARNRPFELLSARMYLAVAKCTKLSAPSEALLVQLKRLAVIAEEGGGAARPFLTQYSESLIEFGAGLFLPAEVKEGSELVLEASLIPAKIEASTAISYLISASSAVQIMIEAPAALRTLLKLGAAREAEIILVTEEKTSDADLKTLRAAFPMIATVTSLEEAPLFAAPIAPSASFETIRRDQQMRLEKLVPLLLKKSREPASIQ